MSVGKSGFGLKKYESIIIKIDYISDADIGLTAEKSYEFR